MGDTLLTSHGLVTYWNIQITHAVSMNRKAVQRDDSTGYMVTRHGALERRHGSEVVEHSATLLLCAVTQGNDTINRCRVGSKSALF
jgi:hypothetical protein